MGDRASTIDQALSITGNVRSKGDINLDGQILGEVHCASLILRDGSRLEGNVVAEEVVVGGDLVGSVRALRITLQSKSHVEADLVHQSLAIENGAFFNGKSRPSKNPLSGDSASRNQAQAEPPSVSQQVTEK